MLELYEKHNDGEMVLVKGNSRKRSFNTETSAQAMMRGVLMSNIRVEC